MAMAIRPEDMQQILDTVQQKLPGWLAAIVPRDWEVQMTERIVRVESELLVQRELMSARFDAMDNRFGTLQWFIGLGMTVMFTALATLIAVFGLT